MREAAEIEWTVIACGLIAHADGIMEGAECERLLTMIDEEFADQDYAEWLALISEPAGLEERLASLPVPAAASHRELLERAWAMAMVDGEQCAAEVAVLESLGARLGVEPIQLEFWREAWTASSREFAEWTARSAATALGGDAPMLARDRASFLDLLESLPTTREHRDRLRDLIAASDTPRAAIGRALAALPSGQRRRLLRLVAPVVLGSCEAAAASGRFLALCEEAGVPEEEARAYLSPVAKRPTP